MTIPPAIFRRRPGRKKRPAQFSPPPAALVLVAATYAESTWVQLTFDRPIDVAGLIGSAITVDDGDLTATRWEATGPSVTMIDPATVRIELVEFDPFAGVGILLDATGGSGIVAVDDGGTWAGVSDVALPFP